MSPNSTIRMRLKSLDGQAARTDIDEELAKPFTTRILSPLSGSLATTLMRFTPQAIRKMADEKLGMAGGFGGLTTDGFLLVWGCSSLFFPSVMFFLTLIMKAAVNVVIGLSMIALAVGVAIPYLLLQQRIVNRKQHIQRDLPDVLDILTVSVEAGLGFDGALAKLAEKMQGALVEEFTKVLQEIRMGVPRRDALRALGIRADVSDLTLFTSSLVQADQLGVSIGNVLRIQSAGMRQKRRQRAEEKAMKAPIKMMLPLVVFIFPTIFIILLGPALIQIMAAFTSK